MDGLHVICGYAGNKGFGDSVQPHLNSIQWSETLTETGVSTQAAVADDGNKGVPVFRLHAGVAGYVAFGSAPDATEDPRIYLAAGETLTVFATAFHKVAWNPEGEATEGEATGGFPLGDPVITVGEASEGKINVAIQLKDRAGNDLEVRAAIGAYLSDDAAGDSVAGTAPDTVAIGTDGVAVPLVAGKRFTLISEADGAIDIDISEDGTDTWYLVLIMPDGRLVVSDAIVFEAA